MAGSIEPCSRRRPADDSPFRAVALGTSLPRILSGSAPAVAVSNINASVLRAAIPPPPRWAIPSKLCMRSRSTPCSTAPGSETFEAVKMLKSADPQTLHAGRGANYPRGRFGDALRQTAQLIKANLGVQIAFADIGGWDHHVNEGATEGQLANVLRDFSQSIAAFWTDLGPLARIP